MSGSGISWAICKSAPRSRQITMPAPHHSVFTGQMPFLLPNQQHQSTEGAWRNAYKINKHQYRLFLVTFYANNKHQPWQSKHWGRTSATVMQSEETPSPLLQAICPWHSTRYHILHWPELAPINNTIYRVGHWLTVLWLTSHSTQNRSFHRHFPRANLLAWYGNGVSLFS